MAPDLGPQIEPILPSPLARRAFVESMPPSSSDEPADFSSDLLPAPSPTRSANSTSARIDDSPASSVDSPELSMPVIGALLGGAPAQADQSGNADRSAESADLYQRFALERLAPICAPERYEVPDYVPNSLSRLGIGHESIERATFGRPGFKDIWYVAASFAASSLTSADRLHCPRSIGHLAADRIGLWAVDRRCSC